MPKDNEPTPTPTPTPEPSAGEKTFTQAEVDDILAKRLARVKPTVPDDYADLKTKAGEFDKIAEANKSELDKERDRATTAEANAATAMKRAQDALRKAAVVQHAALSGADADLVWASLKDSDKVAVSDDDAVTGVEEAISELIAAKPHLIVGSQTPPPPNPPAPGAADSGPRGGGNGDVLGRAALKAMKPDQVAELTPAQRAEAMKHP